MAEKQQPKLCRACGKPLKGARATTFPYVHAKCERLPYE